MSGSPPPIGVHPEGRQGGKTYSAACLWQAARPLLTIYGEQGRTFGISTPADGDDFYGRLFTQAENGALPGAVAFRATTQELNPVGRDAFLEHGATAPRRGSVPTGVPGGVLGRGRRSIPGGGRRGRRDRSLPRARPEQGTGWLIGLDVAFSSDPSAAVVVGRDPENRKRLLVAHAERWARKRSRRQRRTGEDRARAHGRGRDRAGSRRQIRRSTGNVLSSPTSMRGGSSSAG